MAKLLFIFLFASFSLLSNFVASDYYGQASIDSNQKLVVLENSKQASKSKDFIFIRVRNIDISKIKEHSKLRLAIWNKAGNYASEIIAPYKASSFSASAYRNTEMLFKIYIDLDQKVSIFIHLDIDDKGKVERNWIGIPKDPYMFSNARTNNGCPGIAREGLSLSAPRFAHTLIDIKTSGQVIDMCF